MRPKNFVDLSGFRFGKLTAVAPAGYKAGGMVWDCVCDCANWTKVYGRNLRLGRTKSCGCARAESISANVATHGQARRGKITSEFRIWRAMHERCANPLHNSYRYYGARGISVCTSWQEFSAFYLDMGSRPSKAHSIDRINVDGNYDPSNCRWATAVQQRANRRDSRMAG